MIGLAEGFLFILSSVKGLCSSVDFAHVAYVLDRQS